MRVTNNLRKAPPFRAGMQAKVLGWRLLAINILLDDRERSTTARCCTSVDNRKTQAVFVCTSCGHETNADVNAARNILAAGHAVLACGEIAQQGFSLKQEPAEAIQVFA